VVKRADHLNVGSSTGGEDGSAPGSPLPTSTATGDIPKVVVRRPDLNVSLGGGESGEDEGSFGRKTSGGSKKKEKEKKDKGKKEKEKKGSGIKGKKNSANDVRSRAGSESDKWPTDPSIMAKIASSLPVPASTAHAQTHPSPSEVRSLPLCTP
jgi:hypothetical protein